MIGISAIIIILLIFIGWNLERLTTNSHSTNQYLSDISKKLDMVLENQIPGKSTHT